MKEVARLTQALMAAKIGKSESFHFSFPIFLAILLVGLWKLSSDFNEAQDEILGADEFGLNYACDCA